MRAMHAFLEGRVRLMTKAGQQLNKGSGRYIVIEVEVGHLERYAFV